MNPETIFVILNQSDFLMGVRSSRSMAEFDANVFTRNNREAGDKTSEHRVVEYQIKNQTP